MLFLLRDGFLSSIGQQNTSVISEHLSIWLHPLLCVPWVTPGSPSRAVLYVLLKYHRHQTEARAAAEGEPWKCKHIPKHKYLA